MGPLLLVGWTEVGPGLLRAIQQTEPPGVPQKVAHLADDNAVESTVARRPQTTTLRPSEGVVGGVEQLVTASDDGCDHMLARACELDAEHWSKYRRPIAADTLRKRLRVGSQRARVLTRSVRARYELVTT